MISKIKASKQLSNLVLYGVGQGFNLVTPLLVVPYLVSVCGEEGFGKIGIGLALSFFLIVAVDYGIEITGVKEVAVNRDNKNGLERIISTAYAARLVLLCLVLFLALIACNTIPYLSNEKALFLMGMPIVIGQFINPTWVFQGTENYKGIAFLNILSKLIYVAGVFLFIKTPQDYIYANLWWGSGMIIANSIAFIYFWKSNALSFSKISMTSVLEYLKANFSIFISQVFLSAQLYLPIMIVGIIAGDAMAGRYKIIEQIIVMFKTYIFLFFNYVYPRVCYLLEKSYKETMDFWKLYNGANFIFIAFSMAVLYYMAEPVVVYFEAQDIESMVSLLRLAVLLPLTLAIAVPLKQLVLGKGYQKQYVRLTMAMVVFNLVLIIILIPYFGLYGVVGSLIIAEALTAVAYVAIIKKQSLKTN